jgi:phosphoadenosine phosphosulfate reductase
VAPGEDVRAGRWRGLEKDECGIHFINGRVVRGPLPKEEAA